MFAIQIPTVFGSPLYLHQTRHTNEQNVDVTTKSRSVWQNLLYTSKQHAQQGFLDVVMAVDGRSQRPGQEVKDVSLLLSQAFALDDIVTGNSWPVFITAVDHVVGQ